MTHEEVMAVMEEIGLPCAYHHFAEGEAPDPPFAVFLYPGSNNFSADGKVYFKADRLSPASCQLVFDHASHLASIIHDFTSSLHYNGIIIYIFALYFEPENRDKPPQQMITDILLIMTDDAERQHLIIFSPFSSGAGRGLGFLLTPKK